jgi:hypothetical protein
MYVYLEEALYGICLLTAYNPSTVIMKSFPNNLYLPNKEKERKKEKGDKANN